jgi:cytochrome c553
VKIKITLLIGSLLGLCVLAKISYAQSPDANNLYHRGLAATCANCHGTDGKGVVNGGMPLINQLSSKEMLAELMEYKSGARQGTIMPQIAKGYSDEQLEIIAKQLGKK